jgi:hypothetical protein
MTAASPDVPLPRRGWDAGRILLVAFGAIAALVACAILAAGGLMIWLDQAKRDSSGYINTPTEHFLTRSYALASDPFSVDVENADWIAREDVVGKLRLEAQSADSDVRIFLGIARTGDAERYLADVASDDVVDIGAGDAEPAYEHHSGGPPATIPAAQRFWAGSASGAGLQVVTWKVEPGKWTIVAMNTDASPGVSVRVRAGARLGFLGWLGPTFLVGGGLLLAAGVTMIVFGVRQRSAAAASSEGSPSP